MGNIVTNKVAAGVVLFNPDLKRLRECILNLKDQVGCIIIYDNSTEETNIDFVKEKIVYLTHHHNDGIPKALNYIFRKGKDLGYEWILTMDQDTVVPKGMVKNFSKYFSLKNLGAICPQVTDNRRPFSHVEPKLETVTFVDFCITSACCTNISVWENIGGFDEFLFIDFVDNDYSLRLTHSGYKILRCNNVVIDQQYGNISMKSLFWVNFYMRLSSILHNKNIAKLTYKKEVSPFRVYYVHRNLLYLNKKFKKIGKVGYRNFYCKSFLGFLIYYSLPSFVRGKEKIKIVKAIFKGLKDGHKSIPPVFEP
jgi:GT2 family glycosyltransferase